jgi:hypothetical protein
MQIQTDLSYNKQEHIKRNGQGKSFQILSNSKHKIN